MKLVDISGTKRRNIWKLKLMNLKINIRNLYRSINGFKNDLFTDSHSMLAKWGNHSLSYWMYTGLMMFSRLTYIHTSEPLVPEPSAFDIEMATEKLKKHKSQGTDKIPAELIKAGDRTICSEIHKLINSIWNKEELPEECKESIIVPIYKKVIKQILVIIEAYHFSQICIKSYPTSCCQG